MLETISSNTKHTQTEQKYFNIYHWLCKKCEIAFRYLSDLDQHLQDKVLHSPTPNKSDNEDVRAKSFKKCKGEATLKPNKKLVTMLIHGLMIEQYQDLVGMLIHGLMIEQYQDLVGMLIHGLMIEQYQDLVGMLIHGLMIEQYQDLVGLMKRTQAKIILFLLRKKHCRCKPSSVYK